MGEPAGSEIFVTQRSRLFRLAYSLVGSVGDAEDIVQDAYLRWHGAEQRAIDSPAAWLTRVVTRLGLDRLRAAQRERLHYTGPWLAEPLVSEPASTPEAFVELGGDLSLAFLALLERLGPTERAAFLLREVFDLDYGEVARAVGKSEPAVRQTVSRARERLRRGRKRFVVSAEAHADLVSRFTAAAQRGDREALMRLLSDDVTLTADGGGKADSTWVPLRGPHRLAWLFFAVARRLGGELAWHRVRVNGEPGLLRLYRGRVFSVTQLVADGERIHDICVVLNPDKLPVTTRAD